MHKECAIEFMIHHKKPKCEICKCMYRHHMFLEQRPAESKHEIHELLIITEKQRKKEISRKYFYRCWAKKMFPFIVSYFRKNGINSRNMLISLESILEDELNKISFTQFLLDNAWKQDDINKELKIMIDIVDKYDVMNLKVKNTLLKEFASIHSQSGQGGGGRQSGRGGGGCPSGPEGGGSQSGQESGQSR